MKYYLIISIVVILSGCMILEKSQEQSIGSIIYSKQVSKKKIITDDSQSTPIISITSATLKIDSITKIKFTNKETFKHYKGEYYYHVENFIDTMRSNVIDSSFVKSDFLLLGVILPPKNQIPTSNITDYGIKFQTDGRCIQTLVTNCSDSPCSTTHQTQGYYKYIGDTIYVTYFLHRFLSNNQEYLVDNPTKPIDDVEWRVVEPYTNTFVISRNKDTLNKVFDSRYEKTKFGFYWTPIDSLTILPTKLKLD